MYSAGFFKVSGPEEKEADSSGASGLPAAASGAWRMQLREGQGCGQRGKGDTVQSGHIPGGAVRLNPLHTMYSGQQHSRPRETPGPGVFSLLLFDFSLAQVIIRRAS